MSVSSEYLDPKLQLDTGFKWLSGASAEDHETDAPDGGLERARWNQVGLGAIALGLYMLLIVASQSIWPVLLGPFVLLGMARLMGLRSLWN